MATTVKQNVSKINYELRRGDTFNPTIAYKDSAGAIIDLSTHTAKMDLKNEIDGTIIDSLTQLAGITLAATDPNITILISDTDTAAYTVTPMVYDLELTDSGGVVKTLMEGTISLKLDVTL